MAVRNVRRKAVTKLKDAQKAGEISEDDLKDGENNIQKTTDQYISKVDDMLKEKEKEILEV